MKKKIMILLTTIILVTVSATGVYAAGDGGPKFLDELKTQIQALSTQVSNLSSTITEMGNKIDGNSTQTAKLEDELNLLKQTVATQQEQITKQDKTISGLREMFKNSMAELHFIGASAGTTEPLPTNIQLVFTDMLFGDVYNFNVVKNNEQLKPTMKLPLGTYKITAQTTDGEVLATLSEPFIFPTNLAAPGNYGNVGLLWNTDPTNPDKYWIGLECGI